MSPGELDARRLLVVAPDPRRRELIASILEARDARVSTAATPTDVRIMFSVPTHLDAIVCGCSDDACKQLANGGDGWKLVPVVLTSELAQRGPDLVSLIVDRLGRTLP